MMAQGSKEINIKKVLGAKVSNIVVLLSREFIILIIGGAVVAPVIFLWSSNWLCNFAFRIGLDFTIFIIPIILLILISLLTIGYQTIKAAIENPVTALRNDL